MHILFSSHRPIVTTLTITRPDDWHVHLRDGAALRHTCADMAVRIEAARSQLWFAAAALKEGRGDAGAHLDAAKHLANEAGMACADSNIQLHGGIGVSEEHDAHLLLKHAMLLSRLFGSKRSLLARLLEARLED